MYHCVSAYMMHQLMMDETWAASVADVLLNTVLLIQVDRFY